MDVFGLWEEVPRENPHMHGENMQTPHIKTAAEIWTFVPLCCEAVVLTNTIMQPPLIFHCLNQAFVGLTIKCNEIKKILQFFLLTLFKMGNWSNYKSPRLGVF